MTSARIDAVTIDFYQTLARHRSGRGRGVRFMEFLAQQGWTSAPWEHQVLYDVFEGLHLDYRPAERPEAQRHTLATFARRVFDRLEIAAPAGAADQCAERVWSILGPESMEIYEDVPEALRRLRQAGYPLAIVSNWQCGLASFVDALGIAPAFEHIVASAEVGAEKPDRAIFEEASRLLGVPLERLAHVGDSAADDLEGARQAGMTALHLQRDLPRPPRDAPVITSLVEIADRIV